MAVPTILIVEDDSAMADTLAQMVISLGYQAIIVHSSRGALDAAIREQPDLILLDLNLPGINGFEVCRYLKRDPALSDTPVIFVSVEGDPSAIEQAKEVGAARYLIKPISMEELETSISETLTEA